MGYLGIAMIMPTVESSPGNSVADAIRGFAAAAAACTTISLLRLPIDAYFSGLGLIRMMNGGIAGLIMTAVMAFIILSVCGFPIWLAHRRLRLTKWWHFAITGAVAGAALASRVKSQTYSATEQYYRWAHGQETIRPALDAVTLFLCAFASAVVFWMVAYRHNRTVR